MGDKVTVGVMEREGFSILESCLGRPINKNSVFEGFSIRKFADTHEETSAIVFSSKETFSRNFFAEKKMKS